jgi:hypothetical protein
LNYCANAGDIEVDQANTKDYSKGDTDAEERAIPIGLSTARKKGKKVPRKNVIPGRLFLSFWNPGGFEKFT